LICGIVRLQAGSVTVGGHDIARDYRAARSLIGLVPQELTTDAFESVWNTVSFSRGLFGKQPNPAHIEKILRDLSLWDKKDSRIMALSGGMKRRVMIAKALSHEPRLLFLDEPTAGVDVALRKDMWAMVRALRESGVTIVLTTHYIEEAEALADRVAVMAHGKLVAGGTVDEIRNHVSRKNVMFRSSLPLEQMRAWPEVLGLESNSGRLCIVTQDAESVLRRLLGADAGVRDVEVRRAGLAEAFAEITSQGTASEGKAS
jgi:ABC-2 type transport system ATP-binding protein